MKFDTTIQKKVTSQFSDKISASIEFLPTVTNGGCKWTLPDQRSANTQQAFLHLHHGKTDPRNNLARFFAKLVDPMQESPIPSNDGSATKAPYKPPIRGCAVVETHPS